MPTYTDPIKFAMQKLHWQGNVPLSAMKRLAEAVSCDTLAGFVSCELRGEVDWEGIPLINGVFSTTVPMTCQRCMSPMEYKIDTHCQLAPVKSEQEAEALPASYDALVILSEEISFVEMIEDELLLCIPTVAAHAPGECKVKQKHWSYGTEDIASVEEEIKNPFAKLAVLKTKK